MVKKILSINLLCVCHGFVQIVLLLGRFALLVVCGSLMVLHEKYAKEPWRRIGLKVPHHSPPPPPLPSAKRAGGTIRRGKFNPLHFEAVEMVSVVRRCRFFQGLCLTFYNFFIEITYIT